MKSEKFQLRGNNSGCAGAFKLLSGRARAQLRGNTESGVYTIFHTVGLMKSEEVQWIEHFSQGLVKWYFIINVFEPSNF
jgi:hypothetical protein